SGHDRTKTDTSRAQNDETLFLSGRVHSSVTPCLRAPIATAYTRSQATRLTTRERFNARKRLPMAALHAVSLTGAPVPLLHKMTTTGMSLDGYRVVQNLGIIRGIVVRSRSIVGNIGAALQTLVGGNISLLTDLCERAREEAFQLMLTHASEVGANDVMAGGVLLAFGLTLVAGASVVGAAAARGLLIYRRLVGRAHPSVRPRHGR